MTIQLNSIKVGKGNTTVKEFLQLTQNLSEEDQQNQNLKPSSYLQAVSSWVLSCWASLAWPSSPSSLFSPHSRSLHLHPLPLQIHCLRHYRSHLLGSYEWTFNARAIHFPTSCIVQYQSQRPPLTCWVIFGFGELFIGLLTADRSGTESFRVEWLRAEHWSCTSPSVSHAFSCGSPPWQKCYRCSVKMS